MPLHRRRRALPSALLALALATGCAAAPPPGAASPTPAATPAAAPTPAAEPASTADPLPPLLQGLGLTPAQVDEALRINADLESAAEPFMGAGADFGRSVAGAARKCKGETPFMEMDAARAVREGEELRSLVLDTVQRVHRLLTPAQRRKVSDRLIEGDDRAKRERRNASRTKDLGPALDLSTMQMMSMLVKAGVLWTSYADQVEPWRVKYHAAILDFARDDFDVHKEPVGAAPLAALVLDFVRTGLRLLVPLLEPKQCEALGNLIDEKLDEQVARQAEKAAARTRLRDRR